MKKENRIKKNEEIAKIVLSKQKVKSDYFFIYYQKNENITRVAVSVSKKIGNSVKRNHAKRIIRELVRPNINKFKPANLVVVVKKDLFGNWYFVDANGNKAQTIAKSGQLTETKHHKADKQPTVSVLEYRPDAESEEVSYVAHLNNFPNFNYNNNMPLKANNYTVDTYEAFYQRQKLMADFNELLQYCKPLMVGTKATDGLKFFQNGLNKMKAHFAIYFSDKEHKYLREFLKQTYTELLPDRFKSIINIDKIVDQFIDEVAGLRQATINGNNENLK